MRTRATVTFVQSSRPVSAPDGPAVVDSVVDGAAEYEAELAAAEAKREVARRMAEAFESMRNGEADPVQVRETLKASRKPRRHIPVADVEDRWLPGADGAPDVLVRIYHPLGVESAEPVPLIVYLHGGGFVLGDLDGTDACCRRLANGAGAVVVSADYRLAPEDPFPAAVEDAWSVTRWVADHAGELGADPNRLVLSGDSAGANLAAVTCILARDRGGPDIAFQVLIYPVVDQRRKPRGDHVKSAAAVLTMDHQRWFTLQYLGEDGDRSNVLASPALARHDGLPPAHIVTGENDPLRDEGENYAKLLQYAGVSATVQRYPGMFHGFFNLPDDIPLAEQANSDVHAILRAALSTERTESS